ncbi:MAG: hypothetical protein WBB15_15750 [Ornithinimicrobium sp.]
MASDHPETGRRRAGALGLALAALCALLAGALLQWSGSHVMGAGWDSVPVDEAVTWCAAAIAGLTALALACSCLLGARHLLSPVPTPTHSQCPPRDVTWVATRAASVLLTLTLGSSPAFADATTEPVSVMGSHAAAISTATISPSTMMTQEIRARDRGSTRNTAMEPVGPDSKVESADDGRRPRASLQPGQPGPPHAPTTSDEPTDTMVAVPDWRPVRAELPVPAQASPSSTLTSQPIPSHPSGLADRPVREPDEDTMVVRQGDSLWAIAAQELGPGASDAHISARWPQWYAANRLTIGPNPDRILPGQILAHPGSTTACPTIGERP